MTNIVIGPDDKISGTVEVLTKEEAERRLAEATDDDKEAE